jgi:hypothetical protein
VLPGGAFVPTPILEAPDLGPIGFDLALVPGSGSEMESVSMRLRFGEPTGKLFADTLRLCAGTGEGKRQHDG